MPWSTCCLPAVAVTMCRCLDSWLLVGTRKCHQGDHLHVAELLCCSQDLMTNPLIVPVKILRGHSVVKFQGVLDVAFHPSQPWVFTAGADTTICLFTD